MLKIGDDEALQILKRGILKPKENIKEYTTLIKIYAPLVDELDGTIVHWHSQSKELENLSIIHSIIITGAGGKIPGIDSYIQSALSIETSLGNIWQNAFINHAEIPEIPFDDSLSFAVPVGLALKDLKVD